MADNNGVPNPNEMQPGDPAQGDALLPPGAAEAAQGEALLPPGAAGAGGMGENVQFIVMNPQPPLVLTPQPQDVSPEALLKLRLDALATELAPGLEAKFPGDNHRQRAELQAKLQAARLQIPIREAAEKEFRAAAKKTKSLLARLQKMGAADKIPEVQIAAGLREMDRWQNELKPKLAASLEQAEGAYYGPEDEDELADQADELEAEMAAAMAPFDMASKVPAPASVTTAIAHVHAVEIKNFVPVPFSGEGQPGDILRNFRTWRHNWAQAEQHLDGCVGVTAAIKLSKMLAVLSGAALDIVKDIPAGLEGGYELALKDLDDRYHDPVALASAFLASAEEDRPKAAADALNQLGVLQPVLEEEGVKMPEFYVLAPILTRLPDPMKASWKAHTVAAKNRHEQGEATKEGDKTPWKAGMALNVAGYTAWREEYAARNQAPEGAVFLAGTKDSAPPNPKSGKCPIHGAEASHDGSECREIGWKTGEEWVAICRKSRVCYRCFGDWQIGHKCPPLRCPTCQGDHRKLRHNKSEEDAAASKAWTAAARSSNRQQRQRPQAALPPAKRFKKEPVTAKVPAAAIDKAVAAALRKQQQNSSGSAQGTSGTKKGNGCLLYTSPSPRDKRQSRMPSSA